MMVELRTRKRVMRGDWGNHHEKLGIKRISCASQFTVPDTAGTNPDPACNKTDSRTSQPIKVRHTSDLSYLLVSCTSFSSSSPSLPFLSTTLPLSQNTKLSYPSPSLQAMIIWWHHVQYTVSTASTQDCLSSVHSHYYKLTLDYSFSLGHASLYDRLPSACSP